VTRCELKRELHQLFAIFALIDFPRYQPRAYIRTARVIQASFLKTWVCDVHGSARRGWIRLDWGLTGRPEDEDCPPVLETVVLVLGVGRWGSEQLAQCAEHVEEGGHDLDSEVTWWKIISFKLLPCVRSREGKEGMGIRVRNLIFLPSTSSWSVRVVHCHRCSHPPLHPQQAAPTVPQEPTAPTDYGQFVVETLAKQNQLTGNVDQTVLRHCISLSSSFLMTDSTTNPTTGLASWNAGFNRLVDIMVALHRKGQLELSTINAASKACSECWSVAGSWRNMEDVRQCVKNVATKLQGLLDENGRTYGGNRVYTP